MPQMHINKYFKISRSSKTQTSVKRHAPEFEDNTVNCKVKKPAYEKFSLLIQNNEEFEDKESCSAPRACNSKIKKKVGGNNHVTSKSVVHACSKASEENKLIFKPTEDSGLATSFKTPSALTDSIANKAPLPAHQRFQHLIGEPSPGNILLERCDVYSPLKDLNDGELTQTEEKIPPDLLLPYNHQVLLDLFRSCDTVVSMLHNRSEICGFDKLKPAVQEIVRRNFEETHVGQFLAVYPMVYILRYEKQLDKYTRRHTGDYVLVLTPNLRTDGTQIGHDSPRKGHLVFTGTRLIQRRNRFHRLLLSHVKRAHNDFLQNQLGIDASQIPDDKELRRWHPRFRLDTMVPEIQPSPLPIRPSLDQKVLSARDAVKAFQSRALFLEADICQNVANAKHSISIPSPSRASACSPRKLVPHQLSNSIPSAALFVSDNEKPSVPSASHNLKGISERLLAKVRARENERRLLTQLTRNCIPESRRAIYDRLPSIITQVWTVMRPLNGRPLSMATVASRIADAHPSGLSAGAVNEHLNVLLEFCPEWLEKLNLTSPHLRIRTPAQSVKDVVDAVKSKLASEGFSC